MRTEEGELLIELSNDSILKPAAAGTAATIAVLMDAMSSTNAATYGIPKCSNPISKSTLKLCTNASEIRVGWWSIWEDIYTGMRGEGDGCGCSGGEVGCEGSGAWKEGDGGGAKCGQGEERPRLHARPPCTPPTPPIALSFPHHLDF